MAVPPAALDIIMLSETGRRPALTSIGVFYLTVRSFRAETGVLGGETEEWRAAGVAVGLKVFERGVQ